MSEAASKPPPRPRWRLVWIVLAVAALAVVALGLLARFGPQTSWGRSLIEAQLDQVQVGDYGRLHVDGLAGDPWRDFSLRDVTIVDSKGPWLAANQVRIRWEWTRLWTHSAWIDEFDAAKISVLRRPIAGKPLAKGGPTQISTHLGRIATRLELLPAFSSAYGLYDVGGALDVQASGALVGHVAAASLTHAGDHLDASFDVGHDKIIRVSLDAREAQGGAMAGALGLAANQPFFVVANAAGTTSQGRFQVTSRSGAVTPLQGAGAWSPAGGQAHGVVVLASSKLLSAYQTALGPQLTFDVTGVRAADGFDAVQFKASSENVDAVGQGEADFGRRTTGPKGVQLSFTARQAQRLIGWPAVGAGKFSGVFTGNPSRWTMAGDVALDDPNAFDYQLAHAHGQLKLVQGDNELTLQTVLDGDGGAGKGVVPAMLGARPHAAVELVFMPGTMLIKQLAVDGPGLHVTADGQRKWLGGGLGFTGQATFSNFAQAHPGATGTMTASWSASQATGADPWTFSFDAKATGFASGYADVDRLVGQAPALQAQATWGAAGIQIAQAHLTGQVGDLNAAGLIGSDNALAMKTDWRAKGPIDVGPLELTGAADGVGDITGTLATPRADLTAQLESVGLPELTLTAAQVKLSFLKGPQDTNGAFSLAASSPYGPASIATGFRFTPDGVDLTGLDAQAGGAHAEGQVSLRSGAPSAADLAVSLGRGAFLTRGQASGRLVIQDAAGGPHATLKLAATEADTRAGGIILQKASLTADGPLSAMAYHFDGIGFTPHGSWNATGSGTIDGAQGAYGLTFDGAGRLRNTAFKMLQPMVLTLGDKEQTLTIAAEIGGGQALVRADQTANSVSLQADMSGVALGLVEPDLTGQFNAAVSLQGQGKDLSGNLQAKLTGAGERGAVGEPTLDGVVDAKLTSTQVVLDANLGNGQGMTSSAHLVLPAEAAAAPFRIALVRTQPISGEFQADGEVAPLWDLVMGQERSLSGVAHAHGTVAGTLADPRAQGQASIDNGAFSDAETGLKLRAVSLQADLSQDAVDVSQFSAQDGGGGQLNGSGRISLEPAGSSSFKLDLKGFRLIDNDIASASASGEATISRAADGTVKLTGALTIDRADAAANPPVPSGVTPMDVIEVNRQPGAGGGHLQAVNAHAPAVDLDVSLKAVRGVFLKGRGLDLELSMDAHVGGSTAAPQLTGVARVVRGDYDFAGKRFEFDNRGVVYLAANADAIRLDLTATRDDPSLTAVIQIQGTATKPQITLTSTPVLPEDEVLSQVLFGTSASQLGAGDAAELASATMALSGGSGLDVLGNLRSFAHLDRLAMGTDEEGGVAVSGGKYVTDNVYLELTGGGREGPSGEVDWRVRHDLSVVSKIAGSGGDSQVEVRWRKDF
ncbi:MAG TPA: translocation/assembly module TamB domain-containing protein [Caulobacteraceae bacterium]